LHKWKTEIDHQLVLKIGIGCTLVYSKFALNIQYVFMLTWQTVHTKKLIAGFWIGNYQTSSFFSLKFKKVTMK